MKKYIYILIFTLALSACDKVYINGELDGMWKLQQVECDNEIHHPTDIYYSFQRHMAQIGKYHEEGLPLRFIGNMKYMDNTLTIGGFRKFLEEERICSLEELQQFYLYDETTTFIIDKLDDELLIMHKGNRRYTLNKW